MSQRLPVSFLRQACVAGSGVVVGLGLAWVAYARLSHKEAVVPAAKTAPSGSLALVQALPTTDSRVSDLDRRLATLEARSTSQSGAATAGKQQGSRASMALDDATAQERWAKRWVDRYASEQADPSWADSAGRSLGKEIRALAATNGLNMIGVTCRTTMCAAEIEGPDFATVAKGARTLVTHGYEINCARSVSNPPPENPQTLYRTVLYLDCEKSRSEAH